MTALAELPMPVDGVRADDIDGEPQRNGDHASVASLLLAVCGVCGGAGTSTLSYLLARFAVERAGGHVLVCDTGGAGGGLAACAGLQSPRSLTELAARVNLNLPLTGGVYAVAELAGTSAHELRVIATRPRLGDDVGLEGLESVLAMARADDVHALTVVDCGTLQTAADRLVMSGASHVAWVLPATTSGARSAEHLLAAVGPRVAGRELVVARHVRDERSAALKAVRELTDRRCTPLLLLPHLSDPERKPDRAVDEAQVALQALLGALQR